MRRLNLILLATFQVCSARSPGFSVHEDLLAFPQFEVVFSENFISQKDAQALLDGSATHPTYSADFSQPTAGDVGEADASAASSEDEQESSQKHVYEIMNMMPHQYLCSIPLIEPPAPENKTATELARAEEARQLSRAAENGWALLHELEDLCLYYMSGWWSYRFCNNKEIVQFHAVATLPNGQAPKPDPNSMEYILGQVPALPASVQQLGQHSSEDKPIPAELQVKGDQRYLVQKLVGGTICDLTGRERTIEVQYHCAPGMKNDRIGWIKEVTICAYVMVVNTPRLCNDVAFLPPKEKKANPISCQLIVDKESAEPPLLDSSLPGRQPTAEKVQEEQAIQEQDVKSQPQVVVGGIAVGSRKVLSGADEAGKPPLKLEPPRSFYAKKKTGQDQLSGLVASREGVGKVQVLSNEELEKLDLSPEVVEEMREQMEKIAGDVGWKLEIVELPGGLRELRGYIDGEDDEDQAKGKVKGGDEALGQDKDTNREKKVAPKAEKKKNEGEDEEAGSEEKFFKEEL